MGRKPFQADTIIGELETLGSEDNRAGMKRFGIDTKTALGVSMPNIRKLAKGIEKNHDLALALWLSGIHEARILASLIDQPHWVTGDQMDAWVEDFNSWDLCDQVTGNLFDRAPGINRKINQWAASEREFVRRAAFSTIAWRSVHAKHAGDAEFLIWFQLIEQYATDPRNFVKKSVNWALRQMGKRSLMLHGEAVACATRLGQSEDKTARWVGNNALKELESQKLIERLTAKQSDR